MVLNVRRPIAIDSGMVVRSVGFGAPLTKEEIINAIKKLKNNRSSGNDGITAELLKPGPTEFFVGFVSVGSHIRQVLVCSATDIFTMMYIDISSL